MEKKQHACSTGHSFKYWVATLLILTGSLLLARNMGWIDHTVYSLLISWQMLLIVIGLFNLTHRHWFTGTLLIVVGGCFLAPMLDLPWFPVNMSQLLWPAVLIIIGVSFLGKSQCKSKHWNWNWDGKQKNGTGDFGHTNSQSSDGYVRVDNAFGSVRQVVLDEQFKGASIQTRFGGTIVDLRRTEIAEGETYIDIDCSFGGIELFIPSHWKVDMVCDVFMGGCEDKRLHHPNPDQTRVLVLRGHVSLSGVEIKS